MMSMQCESGDHAAALSEAQSTPNRSISCLPPEIVSHIFVIGSQDNDDDDEYADDRSDEGTSSLNHSTHFATLCSHVCQYWRNIAIDTPQLWSCLDFDDPPTFEKSKQWIARSKEVSLTIQIDLTGDEEIEDTKRRNAHILRESLESQEIISIIFPHIHRWRTFELVVDHYELAWLWQTQFERIASAPVLEHLGFFCHEDWVDEDVFHPQSLRQPMVLFPGGMPKLQSVCLWGVHFLWEGATFFEGLVCLQLAWHTKDVRLTCEQFAHALSRSPQLHVLTLEGSAPLPGIWPQERIHLHSLRVLVITYIDVSDAVALIDHIDFPGLRTLTLDLEADSMKALIRAVCRGNKPRFGPVESLKLTSFNCTPADGMLFLSNMPNLMSMTLNFNYLPIHFHKSLVSTPSICPKLNTLKLSGLDPKRLKSLIKARQKSPTLIQRLYLDKDDDFMDGTVEWLRREVETVQFYEASDDEEDEDSEEDEDEDEDSEEEEEE